MNKKHYIIFDYVTLGKDVLIGEYSVIGRMPTPVPSTKKILSLPDPAVFIDDESVLCSSVVIYASVKIGKRVLIADHSSVFCNVTIGNDVIIGRNVSINSETTIGNNSRISSNTHVTGRCCIGERVFVGVGVSMANDSQFGRKGYNEDCKGPTIEDDVCVGTGAILTPGVRIGKGSVVAAGSVVKRDVPDNMVVSGFPARIVGPADILFNR